MYYRLNENYVLRGWIKQNAVLVRRPRNQTYPLKAEEFNLLTLCDGETDFDDIPLSPEQQDLLNLYIRRKAVTELNSPVPLEEDQVYRFYPNRFVSSVFWSVTGRCNYRCRHCYMDAPNGALGELSYEEAIDLIDQMADCGVLTVDITGGEPFVRKDIWRLIDRIVSHRMTIGVVYTNGWLLNERVLDQFEQRNLKPQISISFDGLGWHDWMRGVNGAEEAALKALLLCKKRGFPMDVELCVHRGNLPVLRETVNRLAEIGVTQLRFGNVSQTELWKCHSEGNDLSFREYVEAVLDYIPYFFEDGMRQDLLIGGIIDLHRGNPKYKVIAEKHSGDDDCLDCNLCGAVRYSSYITPEGRLLPCMPMTACKEQAQFARIQDMGLRKGLSDSYYMQFADSRIKDLLAKNKKCNACPYKLKCGGGCRATALAETGDLLGSDSEQCFLWKNGYVEKIHQVADEAIAKYCHQEQSD